MVVGRRSSVTLREWSLANKPCGLATRSEIATATSAARLDRDSAAAALGPARRGGTPLYDSPLYPVSPEEVDAFVAAQRHGTLIATPPGGHPRVTMLPFVKQGGRIDLHCVQADPTFAAVCENPRVTFFVSDFLAFSPHDWVDADDAARATLHFRAVTFECVATVSTDPVDVAATLSALLRRQEPDAAYREIKDDALYGPRLRRLAAIRLDVVHTQAKFKLGPGASIDAKRKVIAGLRTRNEPGDARAADIIEAALKPHIGASGAPRDTQPPHPQAE